MGAYVHPPVPRLDQCASNAWVPMPTHLYRHWSSVPAMLGCLCPPSFTETGAVWQQCLVLMHTHLYREWSCVAARHGCLYLRTITRDWSSVAAMIGCLCPPTFTETGASSVVLLPNSFPISYKIVCSKLDFIDNIFQLASTTIFALSSRYFNYYILCCI